MAVDDAAGTVTVCQSGRMGLYADDHGLTVRNAGSRARRFAWAEVSHFADGSRLVEGSHYWILHIVLQTRRKVEVDCTRKTPLPETLTAVRQVAARYGIPADLAGVPMKDGGPARRGLYQDPGGQAGLRFWDGRQWSPLLRPRKPSKVTAPAGPASWLALPTADGHWTYAATQATRWTVWFAVLAPASIALLAGGLGVELWWDRGTHHRHMSGTGWFTLGGFAALYALLAWRKRKFFLKLDEAAKRSAVITDEWN